MASFVYNSAKSRLMSGDIDLNADDIRVVPLMTNTTADTENDTITTLAGFTTLDEFDGSGYTSGGIALSGEAVNTDDTNDRAEFDATDISGLSYGDGTRQIAGLLVIKFVTDLNSSYPISWIDTGGFPLAGSVFSGVTWNAEGILQGA